jgi:TolA-binding protein
MTKVSRLFGFGILGLALLVGVGASEDKKDDKKTDKKKDEKKKDTLPPFFKDLGLNDDQKAKIAGVQKEFAPKVGELQKKIAELNKQMAELKKQEQSGVFGVLTDEQKKAHDAAVANAKKKKDLPKDKKKEPDKKKDPDKK